MLYNKNLINKAKTFLANKNVEVDFDSERTTFSICVEVNNERIWTGGEGYWSEATKGVKVEHANFLVTHEEDYGWNGGLSGCISYDGSGLDGTWYDGNDVANNTLINKIKDVESDGMIYGSTTFINNLKKYMVEKCDYDMDLQKYLDFDYSEQGMQDDELVNLDVECDADFWLHVIDTMQQQGIAFRQIESEIQYGAIVN